MKRFAILLAFGIAISSPCLSLELKVGDPFPVIAMPRSDSGELESIESYSGKKRMVHVFAAW